MRFKNVMIGDFVFHVFQLPAQVIKPLSQDEYPNVTANVTTTTATTPDSSNGTQVCR